MKIKAYLSRKYVYMDVTLSASGWRGWAFIRVYRTPAYFARASTYILWIIFDYTAQQYPIYRTTCVYSASLASNGFCGQTNAVASLYNPIPLIFRYGRYVKHRKTIAVRNIFVENKYTKNSDLPDNFGLSKLFTILASKTFILHHVFYELLIVGAKYNCYILGVIRDVWQK